jgi:toxin ParE1/3/4
MSVRQVRPRAAARQDIKDQIDFYLRDAGETVALEFIDAVEDTFRLIGEHPRAGSPRYAHELDLPGLSSVGLQHFPFLVFYVERQDHVDVWRILHAHRDIPGWLGAPEG